MLYKPQCYILAFIAQDYIHVLDVVTHLSPFLSGRHTCGPFSLIMAMSCVLVTYRGLRAGDDGGLSDGRVSEKRRQLLERVRQRLP